MNRRDFLKTSAAVTAATAVLGTKAFAAGTGPDYTRSVHFMYPQLLAQGETFTTLSNALNLVSPHVTFLSPLFLNVANPKGSAYTDILNYVNTNNIKFGAAVGGPGPGNQLMDGTGPNQTVLQAYDTAGFQPYLRVDNLSGFYQNPGGEDDIKQFLTLAISMGFHNIMLNPWPYNPNGNQYMPITEANLLANIDSCFQNASYQNYTVIDADIQNILTQTANQPSTPQILINYESPGPQTTISKMPFAQQINTFNITLDSINSYPPSDHLHWAPPFTGSYDPLQQPGQGSNMWAYFMVPELESFTEGTSPVQQPFQMSSPSSSASVIAGSSTTFTINVTPGTDPNPTVSFSVTGLPSGATSNFNPSTVTGGGSTTLSISANSGAAPGVYPLTVVGSSGTSTFNLSLSLTVSSASSDFSISASPSALNDVAGDTVSFAINFASSSNYLGNPALSVTGGLPAGATATFSSPTVGSGSPVSSLSISTPGTTPQGAYRLTISATDGSITHSTTAVLVINPLSNGCMPQIGNNWVNGILPTQTGTFTAEWDAIPSTSLNSSQVGLSLGAQSAFTGLAIAIRFNPTGQIDAFNGGAFEAASTINYQAGVKYHFRVVVNVPENIYSVYVTPAGQPELTVGTNYMFRAKQAGITSLDHWDAISQVGTIALCNLVVDTPPAQGAVQLVSSASLLPMGDGSYLAILTISNRGAGTAQNVTLSGATLGSATASMLPGAIGDLQPGASVIEAIAFSASAGSPGSATVERYTGTYTGGSFGSSFRVTLPSSS